jgi:hypothetical protein
MLCQRLQLSSDQLLGEWNELWPEPLHQDHRNVEADTREQNVAAGDLKDTF